jgi:hypothetical protein
MECIDYIFNKRDTLLVNLRASEKIIVEDATINLDANGVPQTCYCLFVDAPEQQPDLFAGVDAHFGA